MAKKKSFSLGASITQALTDTVSAASNYSGELHVEVIPLRKIELDEANPRELVLDISDLKNGISTDDDQCTKKQLEKESLASMARSIKQHGVINPIVVYKNQEKYQLIAGERRTLASIIADKDDIPAKILTSRPNELKRSLLQWIENIEREDLSLWERLINIEKILTAHAQQNHKEVGQVTSTELSQLIGCSLPQAANYMYILNASDQLKLMLKDNKISNIEKAALIAKSPAAFEETLIQAALNAATLKELKSLSKRQTPKILQVTKQKGKGRQQSRVNFGSTKNTNVAKVIIQSILANNDCHHLFGDFGVIKWDDYKSLSQAFQHIISTLEKTK